MTPNDARAGGGAGVEQQPDERGLRRGLRGPEREPEGDTDRGAAERGGFGEGGGGVEDSDQGI